MFGRKSLRVGTDEADHWVADPSVDDRYRDLVARLSAEAGRNPVAYRRRVVLAALIGYAFIVTIALVLLAIAVACIAAIFLGTGPKVVEGKIAIVTLLIVFALLRSMAIAPYRPSGIRLEPDQAPALFALVDRVNRSVNGPPIEEIYITDELNASMAQPARFAVFGVRNILSLGLPIMQALTERELASVIAHEIGHSVGGHGKWAGFVYRVRVRWMQIAERLPSGWIAALMRRFFNWYGPWFNAYSFVLARSQEYEADQVAARVATPEVAGSALLRLEVQADRFGNHWSHIWSGHRAAERPAEMPFQTASPAFRSVSERDPALLERALAIPTGLDDTHPSLADRLAALPAPADLPEPIEASAADALLGPLAAELAERFDRQWWEEYGDWWQTLHRQAKDDEAEYQRLKLAMADGPATLRQHVRFIELAAQIDGEEAAIAARRAALAVKPRAASIRFQLGLALMSAGDAQGVEEVERAIGESPSLAPVGYRAIVDFLQGSDRAAHYEELLGRSEAQAALADQESNSIDQSVELRPLALDDSDRAELIAALREVDGVTEIVAGERTLTYYGRQIVYAFAYRAGCDAHALIGQINERMLDYADCLGVERSRPHAWLVKKLEALEGSRLI